VTRPFHPYS